MRKLARHNNLARHISEELSDQVNIIAVFSSQKEILIKGTPKYGNLFVEQEIKSRLSGYGHVEFLANDPFLLIRVREQAITKAKKP